MGRAYGHQAELLFAYETVDYGTASVDGTYYKLPFITLDVGGERPDEEDPALSTAAGRDPNEPLPGLFSDGGQIVVPLDLRNIGFWLKLQFDKVSSANVCGVYTHTFVSGDNALPSATVEVGYPDASLYYLNTGVRAESIALGLNRQNHPVATIQLVGQDEAKDTSSVDSTPNTLTYSRFTKFQGMVQRNGTDLSNVINSELTYANNLEVLDDILRSDDLIEDAEPGLASLTGSITTRFADDTLRNDADTRATLDLDHIWTIDADNNLTVGAHQCHLSVPKRPIGGPGAVQPAFPWVASYDSGESEMLEILLENDVADYVNAS